jgi:GT2 family glycosyltransferase
MVEPNPVVSICIPHWQVQELVTLCLRAIRKYSATVPYEVLVVDNGSQDASLDYLRSLPWIRLIERGQAIPENWVTAFQTALDVGLAHSRGRYFVIMHTDTIVKRPQWLERLMAPLQADPQCAASGAWKLEMRSPLEEFTRAVTDTKKVKLWLRRTLLGDAGARQLTREVCPRDYCAMYCAEPIRWLNLRFECDRRFPGYTAGEQMFYQLKENGYRAEVIPTAEMMQYLVHLGHATAGLRPAQRRLRHTHAQKKSEQRLRRLFGSDLATSLAADVTLDR